MTQQVCREKSLYYRPNTDHFFQKYRPNTNQFSPYFPKIQTNIIFVSPFLDQSLNIVQGRTGVHRGVCIEQVISPSGKQASTYPKNKEIGLVNS